MRLPFTVAPDDWLVKGAAGLVFSSLQFSLVRDKKFTPSGTTKSEVHLPGFPAFHPGADGL